MIKKTILCAIILLTLFTAVKNVNAEENTDELIYTATANRSSCSAPLYYSKTNKEFYIPYADKSGKWSLKYDINQYPYYLIVSGSSGCSHYIYYSDVPIKIFYLNHNDTTYGNNYIVKEGFDTVNGVVYNKSNGVIYYNDLEHKINYYSFNNTNSIGKWVHTDLNRIYDFTFNLSTTNNNDDFNFSGFIARAKYNSAVKDVQFFSNHSIEIIKPLRAENLGKNILDKNSDFGKTHIDIDFRVGSYELSNSMRVTSFDLYAIYSEVDFSKYKYEYCVTDDDCTYLTEKDYNADKNEFRVSINADGDYWFKAIDKTTNEVVSSNTYTSLVIGLYKDELDEYIKDNPNSSYKDDDFDYGDFNNEDTSDEKDTNQTNKLLNFIMKKFEIINQIKHIHSMWKFDIYSAQDTKSEYNGCTTIGYIYEPGGNIVYSKVPYCNMIPKISFNMWGVHIQNKQMLDTYWYWKYRDMLFWFFKLSMATTTLFKVVKDLMSSI